MPIELNNLKYTYMPGTPFETTAIEGLSLRIEDGEFLGLIGQTGSGKTTLIGLMAGLLKPTEGTVIINGEDINKKGYDRKALRRHIGVVFQYPEHQLFEETVYKDIAFGPIKTGVHEDEIEQRVKRSMELMELDYEGIKDLSPFELSGGQKRRVAIAGVLAVNPKVLILDEPVAGLDPKGRQHLMQLIGRLNAEGVTIIMITHSMDDLAENAKRVVVLSGANVIMDDKPSSIFLRKKEIKEAGLALPAVAEIASQLRAKGWEIPKEVIKLSELEECLVRIAGKNQ
ncbi:MAG: energy-coupling factor transporter ATPase [Burkholderiales bacterium]